MDKELKIAILDMYDGHPNEGMRCIKMLLREFLDKDHVSGSYDIFDVRGKGSVPKISEYDIYVSTGGPGNPTLEGTPWEKTYFDLIDEIVVHNASEYPKKYVFFICHSFQLVLQHFGFGDITKRKSTSFGVMPIHKEEAGEHELLFKDLEDPFWAVDSRDYQFIQPRVDVMEEFGATILALEKERPHVLLERAVMAVRFSEELFGTQFHPEADAEGMRRYFLQEDKKKAVIEEYGEEKFYDMIEHLEDPDKIMFTESVLIPQFLESSAQSILYPQVA